MASFTFLPSLYSSINVFVHEEVLFFSAFNSNKDSTDNILQIWTNLPSDNPTKWVSVDFVLGDDKNLTAKVDLPKISFLESRTYEDREFTFRIVDKSDENKIEWLGKLGSNGRVRVMDRKRDEEIETKVDVLEWEMKDSKVGESKSWQIDLGNHSWERAITLQRSSSQKWFVPLPLPTRPLSSLDTSPLFSSSLLLLSSPSTCTSLVLYPLTSVRGVSTALIGCGDERNLRVLAEKDGEGGGEKARVVKVSGGVGCRESWREMIKLAVEKAGEVLGQKGEWQEQATLQKAESDKDQGTHLPSLSPNPLSFCTWNSLGPNYTLSSLLSVLSSFKSQNCVFQEVLLDDGWGDYQVGSKRLRSWEVGEKWAEVQDEQGAQGKVGLEESVRRIKEIGGAKRVGVWVTINGYWNGISPTSPSFTAYDPILVSLRNSTTQWIYLPSLPNIRNFYLDWFRFMKSCGVDFLKVDNQAWVDCVKDESVRWELLEGMRMAAEEVFGDEVIHCMAGSSRIWNSEFSIPTSSEAALQLINKSPMRTSDDFFPNEFPSHRWHIYSNSLISLLTSNLSFQPDFDMFQTKHTFADFHGLLRCFSPGKIWITDEMEVDVEVLRRMGGRLRNGEWGYVQVSGGVGMPLNGRVLEDSVEMVEKGKGRFLMMGHGSGSSEVRMASLGVWGLGEGDGERADWITERDLADLLSLNRSKEEEVHQERDYAIISISPSSPSKSSTASFSYVPSFSISHSLDRSILTSPPVIPLILESGSKAWKSFTVAEMVELEGDAESLKIAVLGLEGRFLGSEGIKRIERKQNKDVVSYVVENKGKETEEEDQEETIETNSTVTEMEASFSTASTSSTATTVATTSTVHLSSSDSRASIFLPPFLLFWALAIKHWFEFIFFGSEQHSRLKKEGLRLEGSELENQEESIEGEIPVEMDEDNQQNGENGVDFIRDNKFTLSSIQPLINQFPLLPKISAPLSLKSSLVLTTSFSEPLIFAIMLNSTSYEFLLEKLRVLVDGKEVKRGEGLEVCKDETDCRKALVRISLGELGEKWEKKEEDEWEVEVGI